MAGQEPCGGDRARDYAARVLAASGGTPPDLTALVTRMVQMTRGCPVVEAEVENHRDTVVAEVECRHGDVEVELAFDTTTGAVISLEVEREDETDESRDDIEDEIEHEIEHEIESEDELEDETRTD